MGGVSSVNLKCTSQELVKVSSPFHQLISCHGCRALVEILAMENKRMLMSS